MSKRNMGRRAKQDHDARGRREAGRPTRPTRWSDLSGRRPKGLRRQWWLSRLEWYEAHEKDPIITSTTQAAVLSPALVAARPAFGGPPIGMDYDTGLFHGCDPFVLYREHVIQSINAVIIGDVGVGKSTLAKDHYVGQQLAAGRRVCCFDRKDEAGHGEYGRIAQVAERSGLRVARLEFSRGGGGTCINLLDPRISRRGGDAAGRVGQDELLEMLATELHGPLTDPEHDALAAAHAAALARARAEVRDPLLSDVVHALLHPTPDALPDRDGTGEGFITVADLAEWGRGIALALRRFLSGDLSGLIDGPTCDAAGRPIDLDADLIVVDTSELGEGSTALMLVLAVMTTFIASVWASSSRQSVVIVEEGYSAEFPTVGGVLRSLAKRGRGLGLAMLFVIHHLSDVPPDSPLAALFKEVGLAHIFRQAQQDEAARVEQIFGLAGLGEDLMSLPVGVHVLIEGADRRRARRKICHVQTSLDQWTTYTASAITGADAEPPNPFTEQPDPSRPDPDRTDAATPDQDPRPGAA